MIYYLKFENRYEFHGVDEQHLVEQKELEIEDDIYIIIIIINLPFLRRSMIQPFIKDRKYYLEDLRNHRLNKNNKIYQSAHNLKFTLDQIVQSRNEQLQSNTSHTNINSSSNILLPYKTNLICKKKLKKLEHKSFDYDLNKFYITDILKKYRTTTNYIDRPKFEQFVDLAQQSSDYLQFYQKRFGYNQIIFQSPPTGKFILLCILKNYFQCFSYNSQQLNSRILISLDLNPLNDFAIIDWIKYNQLKRLLLRKDLDTFETTDFIMRLFFASNQKFLLKNNFLIILKSITAKIDYRLQALDTKTIACHIQKLADQHHLFKNDGVYWQDFKKCVLSQQIFNYKDILSLLFDNF